MKQSGKKTAPTPTNGSKKMKQLNNQKVGKRTAILEDGGTAFQQAKGIKAAKMESIP
jgi:hypothetical protein